MNLLFNIFWKKSIFGKYDPDVVQVQDVNGLEILGTVNRPTVKWINQSNWSKTPIAEFDYPWPGHNKNVSQELIDNETTWIYNNFCKVVSSPSTLKQVNAYAHPAGLRQVYGEPHDLDNQTRYQATFYANSRYGYNYITGLYVPPGEVITIKLPFFFSTPVTILINRHIESFNNNNKPEDRLPRLSCGITIKTQGPHYFAWPYGGSLELRYDIDKFTFGLPIKISGCVKMPTLIYGRDSEEDYMNEIRYLKAPVTVFDTGNLKITMPSKLARNPNRLYDTLHFWQGAGRVLYSFNEVQGMPRRSDGRVKVPVQFNIDRYVSHGLAYCQQGSYYIQAPTGFAGAFTDFESVFSDGCWGPIHEYAHNFQQNWGFGWFYSYSEITVNVPNYISYSLMTTIDSARQARIDGNYIMKSDWNYNTHIYSTIGSTALLFFYANNLYHFGSAKQRQSLHDHIFQTTYKRDTYGYYGEYLLHCSTLFNRDMRPYFKTFSNNEFEFNYSYHINQATEDMLDSLNLREFHPVCNIYQTGYVRDGEEFETAKPFEIPYDFPYIFDFVKFMKTRPNQHTFTFVNRTGGHGIFEDLGSGRYRHSFVSKDTDKFYVNYQDDENGDITTTLIRVKPIFTGCIVRYHPTETSNPEIAYKEFYDDGYLTAEKFFRKAAFIDFAGSTTR